MEYNGELFGTAKKSESTVPQADIDKLISIQSVQLRSTYGTDCLDVKQLQQVLNVGETNAYKWMKKCPVVLVIGNRKVVPVAWVAKYLITGKM